MSALQGLRSDLVVKEQTVRNEKTFIVKDPVKQAYFRFEVEEYFVFSQLDGKKTAGEVAKIYNQEFDDDMTGKDIQEFAASVKSMGLR